MSTNIETLAVKFPKLKPPPEYYRAGQVLLLCQRNNLSERKFRDLFGPGSKARVYLAGAKRPVYSRKVVLGLLGLSESEL